MQFATVSVFTTGPSPCLLHSPPLVSHYFESSKLHHGGQEYRSSISHVDAHNADNYGIGKERDSDAAREGRFSDSPAHDQA